MAWRVFAAASVGKSHLDAGTPCQDAFASQVVDGVLLAAVCDGAGSQPLSHVGAEAIARDVVAGLGARLAAGVALASLSAEQFQDEVADCVAAARDALSLQAGAAGATLSSYAATLVGAVAEGERGFFFHIGDGVAVAEARDAGQPPVVSLPENGEYANETYFATGEHWRGHLRVTPLPQPLRLLALMSDGAASFVMARGNAGLFRPFMDPVATFLASATEATGGQALQGTLDDPRTQRITGDDKALLVALWS